MFERKRQEKFGMVLVPIEVLEEADVLIKKLQRWSSREDFVEEACLEKIRREKEKGWESLLKEKVEEKP